MTRPRLFAVFVCCVAACCLVGTTRSALAQSVDSTATEPTRAPVRADEPSRVYFGGSVGLSFGDYFRISIAPLVGYRINQKLSAGVKAGYEYIEDKRFSQKVTASNYGGSLFTRLRFIPQAYLHGEFAYWSYEFSTSVSSTEREWVPFLLLGGGAMQRISPRSWAFVEVLFDVLQDSKSPYEDWEPWINVGVTVGI